MTPRIDGSSTTPLPLTGSATPTPPDHGDWTPQPYPADDTRKAFKIANDYSKALFEWNTKVRAMCAIVEANYDLNKAQFANVLEDVKKGIHDKAHTKATLERFKTIKTNDDPPVDGASDVVGHPPGPTIFDENTV
jgi:hypothetical protein